MGSFRNIRRMDKTAYKYSVGGDIEFRQTRVCSERTRLPSNDDLIQRQNERNNIVL